MTLRACIVTNQFYHSHETMINYHIEHLFEGNTVVACERLAPGAPVAKTVHALRGRRGLIYEVRRRWHKQRAWREHSTDRVLFDSDETAFIRFLRAQGVQIAVSEFGTRAMTVAPAIQTAGIPHVAYFRGYDAAKALRNPTTCEAYRRMMPRLSGIVAVSQFLIDNLARIGATHPNTHVIPSGVDTGWFRPAEKRPGSFLAVGRFVEKKRPDITIRAFAAVAAQDDRLHLDMIGDGVMLDTCRDLAASLGMQERITFHGALPHQQVAEHMARAQVFLQHSMVASTGDAEGVPTAIQEAMACGMVVVSTRHAGIPEILTEGVEGFLVDEGDEAAYTEVIGRVARDADMLGAVATAARTRAVASLDKTTLNRRFEGMLEDVVHGRAPRAAPSGTANRPPALASLPPVQMPSTGNDSVSVIVPTYRDWDGLAVCLAALAAQTFPADRVEILIVNNDPDDPPPPDLPLPANARILTEAGRGSYAARNRALAEARGDVLFFTDADCAPDPTWIAAGLATLEANPSAMRLGGQVLLTEAPGAERIAVLHDRVHAFGQDHYISSRGWAATANMVARRSVFDVVGPFDARLMSGGDKNWGRQAQRAGFPILYAPDVVVRHPPRASVAQIVRKARRVAGGDLMQKLPRRGLARMRITWVVMTPFRLLPPSSKLALFLSLRDLSLVDRTRLYLIQWRLRVVKHAERGRLLFLGGEPERR